MGLDMEILRISKPYLDDTVIYYRDDIEGIILNEEELKMPMHRQLLPYMQPVQICTQDYDMEKIRKDYGLSDDTYISMVSSRCVRITDRKSHRTVEVSAEDLERKYSIHRVEKLFVCYAEEIHYWRKAYDIQEWFHTHIDEDVENTGYYILSGELLLKFNKVFQEDKIYAEAPDEESALFYWEWY